MAPPETMPSTPTTPTEAILSYYHSDLAGTGEPYMADQESGHRPSTTGSEASMRQMNSSNDPSPSSPFSRENKMKNGPFGSGAVHRRKHSNNAESAADNRRFAIVPTQVDTHGPVPGTGDETEQRVPVGLAHGAAEVIGSPLPLPLPSPSTGRGGSLSLAAVDAQLAASGSALVAPTNQLSLHDISPSVVPSSPCSPSPSSSYSHSPTTPKHPHPPSSARSEKSRTARSSAGHSRSSSRDIGIVGTVTRPSRELPRDLPTPRDTPSEYRPPIFQTPSSRPSSLGPSTTVDTTSLESGPSAQTSSSAAVHAAMSASVEPIHSASAGMNGYAALTQQPHSTRSLTSTAASPRQQVVSTPDQGQIPPAAAAPSAPTAPSAYLYYQPGVHSKAGPLPPPPRAMFDIDFNAPPPPRPPRLRSPSPLNSQKSPRASTPTSVTVTLASKASLASIHQIQFNATTPASTESSSDDSEYTPEPETEPSSPDHTVTIHHTREGAFPPSTILVAPADRKHSLPDKSIKLVPELPPKDQLPSLPTDILDSPPVITAGPTSDELNSSTTHCPELSRERSWVSNSNESAHASSESSRHAFEDTRSGAPRELNGPYPSIKEFAPDDSPSENKRKVGLLTNLKRYSSLPRPPTKSPRMSIFSRSPSPKPLHRIRAKSPDAMGFRDILNKRSALERAIGYAHKINELAMYDCGLSDWVASVKERGSSKTRLVPASPQNPDTSLTPRPRHTSRASISSEVTFPLRADAWIATDLSQRDIDTVPSPNVPPPALPYPALAGVTPSTTATGLQSSHTSQLSASSKVTSGFFSALGRNSSTRKDSIRQVQPARIIKQAMSTSPSPSTPNPRPVLITSAPSVPGGPRALPNRVQRSRTLMLAPSSPPKSETAAPSPPMRRRSNTLKRPSFFGRSTGPAPEPEPEPLTGAEFSRQVGKLSDLLPHADKDVLAGYLRRAGQDILAIGQYLEDEKNGSIRRN